MSDKDDIAKLFHKQTYRRAKWFLLSVTSGAIAALIFLLVESGTYLSWKVGVLVSGLLFFSVPDSRGKPQGQYQPLGGHQGNQEAIVRFIVLIAISLLLACAQTLSVHADCIGCCSRHGGVVCIDEVTRCKDGSILSEKCLQKSCNKCDAEATVQDLPTTKQAAQETTTPEQIPPYNRKDWPHWVDFDGDCQDTRSEILQRDNIGTIKWKRNKPCNVSWGKWTCPYTGKVFTKASDVDIDHVVPLAYAHAHGAADWPREKKREFANDPLNLLAVHDSANQAKGDKGPSEWMSPNKEVWKKYSDLWEKVSKKYGLKISPSDVKVLYKRNY